MNDTFYTRSYWSNVIPDSESKCRHVDCACNEIDDEKDKEMELERELLKILRRRDIKQAEFYGRRPDAYKVLKKLWERGLVELDPDTRMYKITPIGMQALYFFENPDVYDHLEKKFFGEKK